MKKTTHIQKFMSQLSPLRLRELLNSEQGLSNAARERLGWIVEYAASGESISAVCNKFGIARSTFHRWLDRFDIDNPHSLEDAYNNTCRHASRVDAQTITLIATIRKCNPFIGKERIRIELETQHGIKISASTIGRIIEKECMYFGDSPLHWRKRMLCMERESKKGSGKRDQGGKVAEESETQRSMNRTDSTFDPRSPIPDHSVLTLTINQHFIQRLLVTMSLLLSMTAIAMYIFTVQWEKKEQALRAELTQILTETNSPSSTFYDER